MVKFFENNSSYDYSWQAVSLAYFLRYPNPYSTHVVCSDVISRHVDDSGCLHTVRIHLKRGKLPPALTRLLPSISESYVLETSKVNPHTMTLETETRNLDHTAILSVIETQKYTPDAKNPNVTKALTSVRFESRLGNKVKGSRPINTDEERKGILFSWGRDSVQRTIEQLGARRMVDHVGSSTQGMQLVLRRLRNIGLIGAGRNVEGDVKDEGRWKAIWRRVREEIPAEEGI